MCVSIILSGMGQISYSWSNSCTPQGPCCAPRYSRWPDARPGHSYGKLARRQAWDALGCSREPCARFDRRQHILGAPSPARASPLDIWLWCDRAVKGISVYAANRPGMERTSLQLEHFTTRPSSTKPASARRAMFSPGEFGHPSANLTRRGLWSH